MVSVFEDSLLEVSKKLQVERDEIDKGLRQTFDIATTSRAMNLLETAHHRIRKHREMKELILAEYYSQDIP